ncbi:hypothetical protein V6N13_123609 [Hibiscus sabdariffa]|uniref:DUF569 domain-containing protein n=1 Tax=Hibiscus sabdariffa TaxID=183260 RepID=A0ABR2QU24_9ROSI
MEIFEEASVVRLRSIHDKYLFADDDEESVSQERGGTGQNARWTVELVDYNTTHIRLKSCFDKYLTASNLPLLLGMTGKKVMQTAPKRLDSSVEWEPIREGSLIRLKTRYGQYLRANAGLPPWRNRITHDIPYRTSHQDWILWHVDVLRYRGDEGIPVRPPPPPPIHVNVNGFDMNEGQEDTGSPAKITLSGPRMTRLESDDDDSTVEPPKGRVIKYEVFDENGDVEETIGERSFTFRGNTLEELKKALEEQTPVEEEFCLCSRNPFNGKLYPLRLHLPPNNAAMQVVVVPLSSKG